MGLSVGIAGVSGYSGGELLRLLSFHPEFEIVWAGGKESAGCEIREVHPWLTTKSANSKAPALRIEALDNVTNLSGLDLLFLSLPAGESSRFLASLGERRPSKVVDIGPDFRLSAEQYKKWYGGEHPLAEELNQWIYGFTEAYRDKIASARHVANPGCYAIAALIALYPIVGELSLGGALFVDGKSGLSGAGRTAETRLQLSEATEDTTPYAVFGHRHQPEIEGVLQSLNPDTSVIFVPHLVPMARGLLVTAYAPLQSRKSSEFLLELYSSFYERAPFVTVSKEPPHTKAVRGSNYAVVSTAIQSGGGNGSHVAVLTAAIDNLGKGAAGSAIQNANVMFGFDETLGLQTPGLWP